MATPLYAVPELVQQLHLTGGANIMMIAPILSFFLISVPQFVIIIFFFVVTRAVLLSYNDWTTKMLGAVITKSPQRSVEINLLERMRHGWHYAP